MTSLLYEGVVTHRRLQPRHHEFSYRVFMPYLKLDDLDELFKDRWLWSVGGRTPASFRREDFLGDPALPLEDEVRRRIREETGHQHQGPIYLLANLRYFGFNMNPIACYYCFNADESRLEYLVAEVTNTPWNERHSYVLQGPESGDWLRTEFRKQFHVSPFNPMGMRYNWRSNTPAEKLVLNLACSTEGEPVFNANLSLQARPLSASNLNRALWRYPIMTGKVALAIYWQALRLFLKRVPFYNHPRTTSTGAIK